MRKYSGLLLILIIFLTGCGSKTAELNEEVDSESEESEEAELEEVKEEVELPELSLDETRNIIDTIIEEIMNIYINSGKEYKLADNPLTDEIYQSMAEQLKAYATDKMVENELYEMAKDFCYAGCDSFIFPTPTSHALRFSIYDEDGLRYVDYVMPEDDLNGSYEDSISLAFVDGEWKLNSFETKAVENLDITQDEAGWLLQENGYQVDQLLEERVVDNEPFYVYQLLDSDQTVRVSKKTGYIIVETSSSQPEVPVETNDSYVENDSNLTHKDVYMEKLARLEEGLAWIDEQQETISVAESRDLEEQRYRAWDDMLNEIYGVIQDILPADEMEVLRQEQREWITYRDTEAERGTENLGGGWQGLQYTINLVELTKDRCYELLRDYLL